jgi:preprotein translocase subunit SecB
MARKSKDDDGKTNGNGPTGEPIEVPPQAASAAVGPGEARAPADAQLSVLAQYVKDLSFESPGSPQTLQGPGQNPQLKVSVNVNASPRAEETYEVALHLEVHAKSDAGVIYNVDLSFGGLFRLRNIPQNLLQPVLFVDCPTLLFPFLRRVLADVVRDGGFPPLMLDPIDFGRLYAQNLAQKRAEPQPQAKN